ncbi:MAG TPA: hypothetical protein VFL29_14525 [Candidatus Dormibacteraeota bacterium]|nr:hypothetical protein [Candidatus Dormibacteraeota bacterium]
MKHVIAVLLIGITVTALLTACGDVGSPATHYTAYRLTCCAQGDIERTWQPGTAVDLHWIPSTTEVTAVNPSHRVTITATLSGPYADVLTLKQGKTAAREVPGSTVTYDDRVAPAAGTVMTFLLPADLPPGLYNLETNWDFGAGDSASAGSVVQVGPG